MWFRIFCESLEKSSSATDYLFDYSSAFYVITFDDKLNLDFALGVIFCLEDDNNSPGLSFSLLIVKVVMRVF